MFFELNQPNRKHTPTTSDERSMSKQLEINNKKIYKWNLSIVQWIWFFLTKNFLFLFFIFRSDFRPTSFEKEHEIFRLRIYKVYAWGVPLIIAGTAAVLDHMKHNSANNVHLLYPRFCETEFWFAGEKCGTFFSPQWKLLNKVEQFSFTKEKEFCKRKSISVCFW